MELRSHSAVQSYSTPEVWMGLIGDLYSHTSSDLTSLWSKHRAQIFSQIEGSFVLVIWEKKEKKLHLFRSKEGIHSLYWTENKHDQSFVFCSELPPLLEIPDVKKDVDYQQLAELLSFRYIHAPRTLVKGINQLPAGEHLSIADNTKTHQQWFLNEWAPPTAPYPEEDIVLEQISSKLRRSVERRSTTKVGLLLSGGLDSSAILHQISTLFTPPQTYTAVLEGFKSNEAPFAARVAKMMGAPHEIISISPQELIDAIPKATRIVGTPLSTPAAAVQHLLFQRLRNREQILISGDGGDELLGGRSMSTLARRIKQVKRLDHLPFLPKVAIKKLAQRMKHPDLTASYEHFGRDRSIGASRIFLAPDRVDILTDPGLVRPGIRKTILTPFYQEVDSDPINEILHVWQRGWLIEDSLMRSEKLSAHCGISIRYPMLDHNLVHYCASLPGSIKVKRVKMEYIAKWPLRTMMRPYLSHRLLHRPKRTLLQPLDQWLCDTGSQFLRQRTDEICDDLSHIFVPRMVQKLKEEHLNKTQNHGMRLWSLILFSIWWHQLKEL